MKRLITFGIIAALLGAGIGIHFRIPIVITLVCLGLAVFSAVVGVQMIVTRKADIPTSDSFDAHKERHTGLSAQFWGVLFLMFAIPFGAFGLLYARYGDNPPQDVMRRGLQSPMTSGLTMVGVGAAIGLYGLTRVIPGKAAFAETKIGVVERTLTAIYLCTVAAVIVLAGCIRILAPGTLTRLRDSAIAWALSFAK
jgi:hypothetical protein